MMSSLTCDHGGGDPSSAAQSVQTSRWQLNLLKRARPALQGAGNDGADRQRQPPGGYDDSRLGGPPASVLDRRQQVTKPENLRSRPTALRYRREHGHQAAALTTS